jgi:hypothetical protein
MTFKAYIDNIHAKTSKSPDDFRRLAEQKGFLAAGTIKQGVKAGAIVDWLKEEYDLGRGHAMAIYALLKGRKGASSRPARKVKKST